MMLQGAVVTLLGPAVARGLLFPLIYAVFLVPFGESLEGPLQDVTVAMIMPLLHLFGVPAAVDGVLITIPNGYFEVAEACRSEEHTSELQSLMRISYAVFCLKKKTN